MAGRGTPTAGGQRGRCGICLEEGELPGGLPALRRAGNGARWEATIRGPGGEVGSVEAGRVNRLAGRVCDEL